jgi:hypothetical protein
MTYQRFATRRYASAEYSATAAYMAAEDAAHIDSIKLERAEDDIRADLMDAGYCNVRIDGKLDDVTWADFLLEIDERGLWDSLNADKAELFDKFCKYWAPYRVAFLED